MPEPECECTGAGYCTRYGLTQSAHHVHLCRTQPAYREKWAARKETAPEPVTVVGPAPVRLSRPDSKPSGPGTELHRLLESVGIKAQGCGCMDVAADMDRLGVAGCRKNRDKLVAYLKAQADKRSWWEKVKAAGLAVATGLAFRLDPADVFGSLVDEAIRRAAPPPLALEWVSTRRLVADSIILAGKLPPDVTAVAGVPRSGMLPAAVIATHLHLPLAQVTAAGKVELLGHGSRGRSFGFPDKGRTVVVDDTVYGGTEMGRIRRHLAGRADILYAAVYPRPQRISLVDVYARPLPSPHLLEWNFANNGPFGGHAANALYGAGVALDLDGVIVHDDESGGPVGGPFLVPRTLPCKLIATGRSESSRAQTEAVLRSVGAKWDRLEMLPDGVALTPESAAAHKAKFYRASPLGFFVESDPVQAELIHTLTGKPVVCPRVDKVWHAGPAGELT